MGVLLTETVYYLWLYGIEKIKCLLESFSKLHFEILAKKYFFFKRKSGKNIFFNKYVFGTPLNITPQPVLPYLWVEDDSEVVTTLPEEEPIVEPVDSKVPKQLDVTPPVVSSPEGDFFILAKNLIVFTFFVLSYC